MRATVIYESMFGNTRTVAKALADELAKHMDVELHEVGAAPTSIDTAIDLVVLGAPTHAFTLSRPASRREAADMTPDGPISAGIGVRVAGWRRSVPMDLTRVAAEQGHAGPAAFALVGRQRRPVPVEN